MVRKHHVMVSLCDGVLNRCDPLGARCIAGAIEAAGHAVPFLLEDRLQTRGEILEQLCTIRPVMCWLSVQPDTQDVPRFIQEVSRAMDGPIVAGNVGARGLPDTLFAELDKRLIAVLGQGEDAATQLVKLLDADILRGFPPSLRKINNLKYWDGVRIIETFSQPSALAKTTRPSTTGLADAIAREDIISARTSSGCNASCIFCTVRAINNGQRWKASSNAALYDWLLAVIDAGMRDGNLRLIDDDLAGDIENLAAVNDVFARVNAQKGTRLCFSFSTRAAHLVDPNDTAAQHDRRQRVWHAAATGSLESVFLGLESGSETQLRRLGKGCTAAVNFEAVSMAQKLGLQLEVGFIPIDPFMEDDTWRQEMRDNLRLAHHCCVWETCPTWLAPARVYAESPLATWLAKGNRLGPRIPGTSEYSWESSSAQVRSFLATLGPALCSETANGLYNLKREIKTLQRYPLRDTEVIQDETCKLIYVELAFVEQLISADSDGAVRRAQEQYFANTWSFLVEFEDVLKDYASVRYIDVLTARVADARAILSAWYTSVLNACTGTTVYREVL